MQCCGGEQGWSRDGQPGGAEGRLEASGPHFHCRGAWEDRAISTERNHKEELIWGEEKMLNSFGCAELGGRERVSPEEAQAPRASEVGGSKEPRAGEPPRGGCQGPGPAGNPGV